MSAHNSEFLSELLDDRHDRKAFTCEVEPLERYLKQQANQDLRKDLSVTYTEVLTLNKRKVFIFIGQAVFLLGCVGMS